MTLVLFFLTSLNIQLESENFNNFKISQNVSK